MVFMMTSYMLWWWEPLPNNASLVYPLYQISTLECRTISRDSLPDNCKIALPIIKNADYNTYQNEKLYTDIYTTLWWANYTSTRDQSAGSHYAVDIASAKWTPLYALADWVVYAAENNSSYGNVVKIKFKYKWEVFFAIYAHMDSYSVKAWDQISKGQKIWTVWNSGNTFGVLWGYHVHFEIDKNVGERPAYAFTNCPDLAKWHSTIIAQWLCRIELFQYTKDPILLLENANATYPITTNSPTNKPEQNVQNPENNTQPDNNTQTQTPPTESNSQFLNLDTSKLDTVWKQFIEKRNISIEKPNSTSLKLNQQINIKLKITNKKTGENFHWTLTQPILFITNNTNVSINPISTVLISHWVADIKLTANSVGNTYVAINIGTAKIADFILNITN